jgi:hypothetical protein
VNLSLVDDEQDELRPEVAPHAARVIVRYTIV